MAKAGPHSTGCVLASSAALGWLRDGHWWRNGYVFVIITLHRYIFTETRTYGGTSKGEVFWVEYEKEGGEEGEEEKGTGNKPREGYTSLLLLVLPMFTGIFTSPALLAIWLSNPNLFLSHRLKGIWNTSRKLKRYTQHGWRKQTSLQVINFSTMYRHFVTQNLG